MWSRIVYFWQIIWSPWPFLRRWGWIDSNGFEERDVMQLCNRISFLLYSSLTSMHRNDWWNLKPMHLNSKGKKLEVTPSNTIIGPLFQKENDLNVLIHSSRVLQRCLCEFIFKAEFERLWFRSENRMKLRSYDHTYLGMLFGNKSHKSNEI